jgi:hypothetical protein
MKYYDDDCEAHKQLKAFAKGVHEGVMSKFFLLSALLGGRGEQEGEEGN